MAYVIGCVFVFASVVVVVEVEGGWEEEVVVVENKSPRMHTWCEMTARPVRKMCCVPCSCARRETLLPVSVSM